MRALAVIDYSDHTRGGHFGPYLIWFVREFAKRFDTVLVFTPDSQSTSNLLASVRSPENVFCHPLPQGPRKKWYRFKRKPCPLSKILSKAAELAPGQSVQGFVMWAYDLIIGDVAVGRSGAPWATLGCISHLKRGHTSRVAESEGRVLELCEKHPDCVSFLNLDQYLASSAMPKLQWLPGNENVQLPASSDIASAIRQHADGRFCLGAFGNVTGPRCVNELLELAKKNPELRFVLAGKISDSTVREDLRPMLDAEKPESLLIIRGFQPDAQLSAAMNAVDATIIDGIHYPVHSSIVTKALLLGKWVLTPESNSWTADIIREHSVGLTYANQGFDLLQEWDKWKQSGGPERGRQVMSALISKRELSNCFDALSQRFDASR